MTNRAVLPNITFRMRVRDESVGGDNPYRWDYPTTEQLFEGNCVLFSLPGAFTPTCSTYQLPDYERLYPEFQKAGIDNIFCLSVNDAFVMNAWAKQQNLQHVKVLPDGSGFFTSQMGMLVSKDNLGFGNRSWRYAAVTEGMKIKRIFMEDGFGNDVEDDPYGKSSPQNILKYLTGEDYE